MNDIAAGLREVRSRMKEAAERAGRPVGSVLLIAVSKKMRAEDVAVALALGQQDFGENYAQELRDKRVAVDLLRAAPTPIGAPIDATTSNDTANPVRWHYLGPIQRNKVKYLAGQVALIHSLDDADLLAAIEARLRSVPTDGMRSARRQACLVQVNVAGENRKGGVPPHRLPFLLDQFARAEHVECRGLMLIPPLTDDIGVTRRHFATLREIAERERRIARPNVSLVELSMGMSGDFVDAIAEGATMVRVGTAIFGGRPGSVR